MRSPHAATIAAASALAAVLTLGVRAEVSATPRGDGRVDTLIMGDAGITDGIDPIPQIWYSYRPLPPEWVLNPSGEERGDGRPDLAFDPAGAPIAVWAYNHGASHDIAIAYWLDDGWSPTELLTSTPYDEVDPRVFLRADGTLDVVWWVDGQDQRAELTTRVQDGDSWMPPVRVSPLGERARRPSVAHFGGAIWVAYERDAQENGLDSSEVAVRRLGEPGSFDLEYLASTAHDGPIGPLLHVENGRFWIDWRHAANAFAYAEIADPTRAEAFIEPWTDPSWVGVESVRRLIAQLVAAGAPGEEAP